MVYCYLPNVLWPIISEYAKSTPKEQLAELIANGPIGAIVVSCEVKLEVIYSGNRALRMSIEIDAYDRVILHVQNTGSEIWHSEFAAFIGGIDELWSMIESRSFSRRVARGSGQLPEHIFKPGQWLEDGLLHALTCLKNES